MTCNPCLIGQVFVDFVKGRAPEPMMRLGGIMHSARTLWAMSVNFGFGYIAPQYLQERAEGFARAYGATAIKSIGTITGCPNVVVVGEAREIGSQQYDYLLREESVYQPGIGALKELVCNNDFTDFLLFPGGFSLTTVLQELSAIKAKVYADINFMPNDLHALSALGRKLSSVILSTSSDVFLKVCSGNPRTMVEKLEQYADSILLKENRGGSRLFTSPATTIDVPAQTRAVVHSVGVGDCFDAVFAVQRHASDDKAALSYASFAAAEYGSYFDDSAVKKSISAVLRIAPPTIAELGGVSLPWETRRDISIYLAAPDFDYVDTALVDAVADALAYHNFSVRRPVRENGQALPDSSSSEKRRLAEADIELLNHCQILIAVLLYDDPGTLIEVGLAIEKRKPVIVFDPFNRATNLMLTELPVLVSSDLDKVISEVFVRGSKKDHGRQ
jgi:nucleoside 2-deoxyribosyltransferase